MQVNKRLATILAAACIFCAVSPVLGAWQLLWSGDFEDHGLPYHMTTIDRAARSRAEGTLLYYVDSAGESLVEVKEDGSEESDPSWSFVPMDDAGAPPQSSMIRSSDSMRVIVFGESAQWDGGWCLPIPEGRQYTVIDSTLRAKYSNMLDEGRLSNDGSVFISFPGGLSGAVGDADPSLNDMIRFYDGAGEMVGEIMDPAADLAASGMAPDGSLFVYASEASTGLVVLKAVDGSGQDLWRFPLPPDYYVALAPDPPIVVGEDGRVAFTAVGLLQPAKIFILDPDGSVIESIDDRTLSLEFAGEKYLIKRGSAVVLREIGAGVLFQHSTGSSDMVIEEADVDDAGDTIAMSVRLRLDLPSYDPSSYRTELYVAVIDVASGKRVAVFDYERDDSTVGRAPTGRGPSIMLSDDGRYLFVSTRRHAYLYERK